MAPISREPSFFHDQGTLKTGIRRSSGNGFRPVYAESDDGWQQPCRHLFAGEGIGADINRSPRQLTSGIDEFYRYRPSGESQR